MFSIKKTLLCLPDCGIQNILLSLKNPYLTELL